MNVVKIPRLLYQERSKKSMGRKKKNGGKNHIEKVLLATAILQLIQACFDLIEKIVERLIE